MIAFLLSAEWEIMGARTTRNDSQFLLNSHSVFAGLRWLDAQTHCVVDREDERLALTLT